MSFCIFLPIGAQAHHSYSEYDDDQTVEIEGTLVRVAWQNPHVHFELQVADANNRVVTWDIETTPLNWFRRAKIPVELFAVGDAVKFAGWPSKRSGDRLYATHMLAADGQEIVLWRTSTPRWQNTALGYASKEASSLYQSGVATDTDSLFRVWASDLDDPARTMGLGGPLPLTEAAQKAAASFDPVNDTTEIGCSPKGMPLLMGQPQPMEFVDEGDTILLRLEEYETVRTIHMNASASAETRPRTLPGYSIGRWDGKTLVVDTTRVTAPYLNNRGVPLGASARFLERFTPTADGSRLDYALLVTDPDSLTEPVEFKRSWVWRPGEEVLPFNCVAP